MSPKRRFGPPRAPETPTSEPSPAMLSVIPEVLRRKLAWLAELGVGPAELRETVLSPQERLSRRFTPGHARFPRQLMPDTTSANLAESGHPLIAGPAYAEAEQTTLTPQPETAHTQPRISVEGFDGKTQSLN